MSEVEKILSDKKLEIDKIKVSDELEDRLRSALENVSVKKRKEYKWILKVASLIIAVILVGYNIDTLAFYGKKLMGFDEVMTDTLKELNEMGKGQVIDKSYTFKNGVKVTLEGAMLDDNQLLLFYSVKDPKGDIDKLNFEGNTQIEGALGRHYVKSGEGRMNDNKTEIKWRSEFEKPNLLEKKLKWSFALREGNKTETGEISFILDKNKAMGHTLKKNISKSIKVDQGSIKFDSIVASPTATYIKGTIQNIFELAKDEFTGEGFRPSSMDIELIANGKEVQQQVGGINTNMNGITFGNKFDALPKDLKTLQIKLVSFGTDNKVEEEIELKDKEKDKTIKILGKEVIINNVYEADGNTYVTTTTEDKVILSTVYLIVDGKRVKLDKTITVNQDKKLNGTLTHTRTLSFKATGKDKRLEVKGITYDKAYNQVIDVQVD